MGWSGPDCSIQIEMTLPPEHTTARSADMQTTKEGTKVTKKETPYGMWLLVYVLFYNKV